MCPGRRTATGNMASRQRVRRSDIAGDFCLVGLGDELWLGKFPAVYVFVDTRNGSVKYVGSSVAFNDRLWSYRKFKSHNAKFNYWLANNHEHVGIVLRLCESERIRDVEYAYIEALNPTFNISKEQGDYWRTSGQYPWSTPRGVFCPSMAIACGVRRKQKVPQWLRDCYEKWSVMERTLFEVETAVDILRDQCHFGYRQKVLKWLSCAWPNVVAYLDRNLIPIVVEK